MRPVFPNRPITNPTIKGPAAIPNSNTRPPGTGNGIDPKITPAVMPVAKLTIENALAAFSESPRSFATLDNPCCVATTRTRSPICKTKSSWASKSTSPRRMRVATAPYFWLNRSSPSGRPATLRWETAIRLKSRFDLSSVNATEDECPT